MHTLELHVEGYLKKDFDSPKPIHILIDELHWESGKFSDKFVSA